MGPAVGLAMRIWKDEILPIYTDGEKGYLSERMQGVLYLPKAEG